MSALALKGTNAFTPLVRKHAALNLRFATLKGQAQELQRKRNTLAKEIGLLKAMEELGPEIQASFEFLLEEANQEAVGDFEDLLTTVLHDVSPSAGSVKLVLGTDRSQPALDIYLDNGGDLENILRSNGGGVTNVVVAGLSYSTLARTKNRQFMLFDEPDCWLKAWYIPNFTKVIAETANPRIEADGSRSVGCQTLMISHNDLAAMDDGAHIQELRINHDLADFAASHGLPIVEVGEKSPIAYVVHVGGAKPHIKVSYRLAHEGSEDQNALTRGYPYVEAVSGARAWASNSEVGIRWIEAINVQAHVKTRLNLSPGLNVLGGDINAGKSTLMYIAMRSMAYGASEDTMIRHGADSMTIRLGLENDVVLELVRSRKGAPKVMFRRFEGGKLVNEGAQGARGSVPSFIEDVLNISKVDGLDVQLRSQKEPIFLLDEPATRIAKVLSVGKEAGLLNLMLAKHLKKARKDKERRVSLEQELSVVNRTLLALSPLAHLQGVSDIVTSYLDDAQAHDASLQQLSAVVARMSHLDLRVRLQAATEVELRNVPKPGVRFDVTALDSVIRRLSKAESPAKLPDIKPAPGVPALMQTQALNRVIATLARIAPIALLPDIQQPPLVPKPAATEPLVRAINRMERTAMMSKLLPYLPTAPQIPVLMDTRGLRAAGVKVSTAQKNIEDLTRAVEAAATEVKTAESELDTYKVELGVCPLCNQGFGDHHHA